MATKKAKMNVKGPTSGRIQSKKPNKANGPKALGAMEDSTTCIVEFTKKTVRISALKAAPAVTELTEGERALAGCASAVLSERGELLLTFKSVTAAGTFANALVCNEVPGWDFEPIIDLDNTEFHGDGYNFDKLSKQAAGG